MALWLVACWTSRVAESVHDGSGSPAVATAGAPTAAMEATPEAVSPIELIPVVTLPTLGIVRREPVTQRCSAGTAVVGMQGGAGQLVDSIAAVCSDLASGTPLSTDQVLERVGGPGGEPYAERCGAGSVVVGIAGGAGDLPDRIAVGCLPLLDALDPASTASPRYGTAVGGDGGRNFEARCPPGSVVGGWTLGALQILDALTVDCVAPRGSVVDSAAAIFTMAAPSPEESQGTLNVVTSHPGIVLVDGEPRTAEGQDHTLELTAGSYELQIQFRGGTLSETRTVEIRPYHLARVFFAL
jgi:hypothetical protein